MLMLLKNNRIFLLIFFIIFGITPVLSLEGGVEYNSVNIDYSILKEKQYVQRGDEYFEKAEKKSRTDIQKNHNYGEALGAYITAIKINPQNADLYGKIGYIYNKLDKYTLSKSYFSRGLAMNPFSPYINYMYARFYFDNYDYYKAVYYYQRSEKYNYADKYSLYYNMGIINEKLGDLVAANNYYKKAYALKRDKNLQAKIKSIDDLKYDKSQYYFGRRIKNK